MMNNKEVFDLLWSQQSIKAASDEFMKSFQDPESEIHRVGKKFGLNPTGSFSKK